MDRKSQELFEIVGAGDDLALQRILLEGKVERNIATLAHGNTCLHEAAWKGFSRCVKILCDVYPKDLDDISDREKMQQKKKKFINRVNFCGFSALHLAAQNGHNQSLRELLYAGCDTTIHNDYGDTPLHTACRYGHAGVIRILISAKCDVDAFNMNHDTPLHIACAMGRRKLTKLLLDAGAMQFQNLQGDTPRDIAKKLKLNEVLKIIKKSEELKLTGKVPDKIEDKLQQGWSPYGCHFYPDMKKFPTPKIETLPKDPLQSGEQYFMDLAGKIKKGPVGRASRCACEKNQTNFCEAAQKFFNETNEKLNKRISDLAKARERLQRSAKSRKSERKQVEESPDPLYSRFKIVGDKNKQIQMKSWLNEVEPDVRSNSELNTTNEEVGQVAVETHARKMTEFDENDIEKLEDELHAVDDDDDDESYSTIDEDASDDDDASRASNNENRLYDESFLRNFQHQQNYQDDPMTSPSIKNNENIEMEMERIAKSLSSGLDALLVSRNPDVVQDSIHHSAKRSSRRIKSAINKQITSPILATGDLYVNTFFANDTKESRDDESDNDSVQLDDLISKVHKSLMNSSDVSTISSSTRRHASEWNQRGRSRNPLPVELTEFDQMSIKQGDEVDAVEPLTTTLNENNLVLLDKLLKARKKLNHHYQQQLDMMSDRKSQTDHDEIIPSSSTLV